jgi:hypothetical protein
MFGVKRREFIALPARRERPRSCCAAERRRARSFSRRGWSALHWRGLQSFSSTPPPLSALLKLNAKSCNE